MNGILVIDKPAGSTSHDVVARVRRALGTKSVGHTGTLDPFATGVLVLLVGKATRLAAFLDKDEKEYEAVVRFGSETDTGDRTGRETAKCSLDAGELTDALRDADWPRLLSEYRGDIEQTPPMYSARKVRGKKLYEHARKGEIVERTPTIVTIREIEMLDAEPGPEMCIRVVCSAGTYVRQLAEDIGRRLGVGAHVAELRRTRAGRFDLLSARTLEAVEGAEAPQEFLQRMDRAVEHLPSVKLAEHRFLATKNGLSTRISDETFNDGEAIRVLDTEDNLLAIGTFDATESSVRPKIVLI